MYPKISIVTVSYNQSEFIEENIKSILEQNYPNVEHVIIDAGSVDGTIEILKKYDKHLNWVSEPDNGQSDGLNKGFKKASGEIIGWINSDDRLCSGALHKVADYFVSHSDEIAVVGNLNLIRTDGSLIRTLRGKPYEYNNMLNINRGVTQGSTFFKKEVFEKIGYLDESLSFAMDFDLFLRISSIKSVPCIDETLAELRIQLDAKTTKNGLVCFRKDHLKIARKYKASIFSKGIRSDIYVILSESLRNRPWIRNFIRKLKGLKPYNADRFE